jgi:UDPglucose 6-dehydrogenase
LPDRIVIGTADECGRKVMSDNYGPLSLNQAPLMFTERRTAEMIKYAANAFLATITFINEVRRRLRKSPRQRAGGRARHRPGKPHRRPIRMQVQARRSCSPKDTKALIKIAKDHDVSLHCPRGRRESQARDGAKSEPGARRFGARQDHRLARLTFKPDTDDMRRLRL